MVLKDISNRKDIGKLVVTFYDKIRVHEVLGPIFNSHIEEDRWSSHLEKLTDFWETTLFGIPKFRGSPTQKHIKVDKSLNYKIGQEHFGFWLQLWFETIDDLFQGETASKAKEVARRMAHAQYLMIWQNREGNQQVR